MPPPPGKTLRTDKNPFMHSEQRLKSTNHKDLYRGCRFRDSVQPNTPASHGIFLRFFCDFCNLYMISRQDTTSDSIDCSRGMCTFVVVVGCVWSRGREIQIVNRFLIGPIHALPKPYTNFCYNTGGVVNATTEKKESSWDQELQGEGETGKGEVSPLVQI